MGNTTSIRKYNFEQMQSVTNAIIINTLPNTSQGCLILNTLRNTEEEHTINGLLKTNKKVDIIIYGMNCNDESIYKKYTQLQDLGFVNIGVYVGGMFEWLLLQDVFGEELFPTTSKELDILKYNSASRFLLK
jgi:hypothetical protein